MYKKSFFTNKDWNLSLILIPILLSFFISLYVLLDVDKSTETLKFLYDAASLKLENIYKNSTKAKNIKVNERKIKPEELKDFVGCFLTGTAAEVTPVSQIDKFNYKVCNTIIELSEIYQHTVRKKKAA